MMKDIKPCICGGKAKSMMRDPGPTNMIRKWVECGKCGMRTREYLTEHCDDTVAIDAWNTRPEEERLRQKCGESCPEGYTVTEHEWDFSICPGCGHEEDEPWDYESYPGEYWRIIQCAECGLEYEVQCCQISYVLARKVPEARK